MASRHSHIRQQMANRAHAWMGEDNPDASRPAAPATAPAAAGQRGAVKAVAGGLPSGLNSSGSGFDEYARVASKEQMVPGAGATEFSGMEGPLPSEARAIIYQHCSGDTAEQAELYARRLLSTHRRVRVYREELSAAVEEVHDIRSCIEKSDLVHAALQHEVSDLDARIAALQRERELVAMQAAQEARSRERYDAKFVEAQQRVAVLRSTIDNIAKDTQRGQMMLQQLVPNLQIDNFC